MVQINFAQKSVTVKIVYYGPGMSGKTTNLEVVHQRAPETSRGELTSISTDGDRTLFFDFMPLDLGTVAGMRTQFQIYTVPGQVYYNSTRKLVLQGVDGVIFVADSSASMLEENLESLRNLEENLAEYGKDILTIPMVIQYNKRDLPDAMGVSELEAALNPRQVPSFEGIANTGQGVFPTLKALAASVLDSIHEQTGGGAAEGGGEAEVQMGVPPVPGHEAPAAPQMAEPPAPMPAPPQAEPAAPSMQMAPEPSAPQASPQAPAASAPLTPTFAPPAQPIPQAQPAQDPAASAPQPGLQQTGFQPAPNLQQTGFQPAPNLQQTGFHPQQQQQEQPQQQQQPQHQPAAEAPQAPQAPTPAPQAEAPTPPPSLHQTGFQPAPTGGPGVPQGFPRPAGADALAQTQVYGAPEALAPQAPSPEPQPAAPIGMAPQEPQHQPQPQQPQSTPSLRLAPTPPAPMPSAPAQPSMQPASSVATQTAPASSQPSRAGLMQVPANTAAPARKEAAAAAAAAAASASSAGRIKPRSAPMATPSRGGGVRSMVMTTVFVAVALGVGVAIGGMVFKLF